MTTSDRCAEDFLFQVLLDWGVDLALPISREVITTKGHTAKRSADRKYDVFFVDDNALAASFDTGINEELVKIIAARKPLCAVFRDAGFANDSIKINVEQIFKLLSPGTEVKSL